MSQTEWINVSDRAPCPVCGKPDWCSVRGDTVMCRRQGGPEAVESRDRHGQPIYFHGGRPVQPVRVTRPTRRTARAGPADLHRVYASLLGRLRLANHHRDQVLRRGISLEAIGRHGFRSWPEEWASRADLAAQLYREHGDVCHGVPGWYVHCGRPALAGGPGWVLPVWDLQGRVVALRLRSDGDQGPRYYWLSSRRHGGPGSGLHPRLAWPGRKPRPGEGTPVLRLVEGEPKAIVVAEHTSVPTLSVPGVGNWPTALPWLEALGVRRVLLCYDADWRTKPPVARALVAAYRRLSSTREVLIETWEVSYVAS